MIMSLGTKLAAISLVAGTAFAWSTAPSAAQPIPNRIAAMEAQSEQVEPVRYHRRSGYRPHRRWHRQARRHRHRSFHRRSHRRHGGISLGFGYAAPYPYAVPYVVAPPVAVAHPPVHVPVACGPSVVVRHGDTMARIAARCGTTIGALLSANPHIYNPNIIHAGQVIRMPWS